MSPDRVALVTGAARGIGAATVRRLVGSGVAVVAVDWPVGAGHALPGIGQPLAARDDLAHLAAYGDRVRVVEGDVADPATAREAVRVALDDFGRLDVAVAAAAVVAGGAPLWETPPEQLDSLWRVDALGVAHLAAAAVPAMLAGPDPSGCRFVAIASAAGTRGLHHLTAYGMVKHAVVGLVRGLAADLVATGVTAVAVAPGGTRTPMLDATADLYGVPTADLAHASLLRDLLDPDEVAATVAFCCSREGRVLNGTVVSADGGQA